MTLNVTGVEQIKGIDEAKVKLAADAAKGGPIMEERQRIMGPVLDAMMAWIEAQERQGENSSIRRLSADEVARLYASVSASVAATLVASTVRDIHRGPLLDAVSRCAANLMLEASHSMKAVVAGHIHNEGGTA